MPKKLYVTGDSSHMALIDGSRAPEQAMFSAVSTFTASRSRTPSPTYVNELQLLQALIAAAIGYV